MSQNSTAHGHHWEVSWAPLAIAFGLLFLVAFGFMSYFVYENMLAMALFAGVGTPLLLAGIAKWTAEGLTETPLLPGVSPTALPIFIVSEVFIFLGFFTTYWTMRLSAGNNWPPEGTPTDFNLVLPIIMTVILVSSSLAYHVAEEKIEAGNLAGFRSWLMITIVLGVIFLGCTLYEYNHLLHIGFTPSTNAFSSVFYSITGFHASHVLVGLGVFVAVLIPAMSGKTNKYFTFCAGLYWHFVDVVWFFVVTQIYYW